VCSECGNGTLSKALRKGALYRVNVFARFHPVHHGRPGKSIQIRFGFVQKARQGAGESDSFSILVEASAKAVARDHPNRKLIAAVGWAIYGAS
jgi:hypothetical protein